MIAQCGRGSKGRAIPSKLLEKRQGLDIRKPNIMIRIIVFTILITGLGLIWERPSLALPPGQVVPALGLQPAVGSAGRINDGIRLSPLPTLAKPTLTPEPLLVPELPTLPATPTLELPPIPELLTLPAESSLFLLKRSLPEPVILTLIFSPQLLLINNRRLRGYLDHYLTKSVQF